MIVKSVLPSFTLSPTRALNCESSVGSMMTTGPPFLRSRSASAGSVSNLP